MIQNNSQNVLAAFDVLIEEIEDMLRSIHKAGASALDEHNYDRAQTAIEHARRVMVLREKVASLKGEWKNVEVAFGEQSDSTQQTPHAASVQRLGFNSANSTCSVCTATNKHAYCSCKTKTSCSPGITASCWTTHRWKN